MPRLHRTEKIASVIEHELSTLLLRELDVTAAVVTILNVEVSSDILQAMVTIGIIPYEEGPRVWEELMEKRRSLQHQLLKKMNIKPMPQIRFRIEEPEKVEEQAPEETVAQE